jgi:tRNA nucleotidyltransferase/poly(A) polymerase
MKTDINIQKTFSPEIKELFQILQAVAKEKFPNISVFAVGGFVRDSIIGKKSADVDIMVSPVSGKDFAYAVTSYIGSKDPNVIKENPDKSKNLETVKSNLTLPSGVIMEVDFAQARSEVYTGESRIPIAKPASPQEDAYRRDFTINSLMYRIYPSPQQVEDFTGKGIKDLISNTIRTPLDQLKTFKEDPLRIFRCIRFSASLNFSIDPETYEALKNPELKNEIMQKVSKERVGEEIKKMLKNPNTLTALTLLKDTGLFADLMNEALKGSRYEGKMAPVDMSQDNPNHMLTWWGHTMQVVTNILDKYKDAEEEKRISMILGALFHDLGKLFVEIQKKKEGTDKYPGHEKGYTTYVGHEEESAKIVEFILRFLKLEPYIKEVAGLSRYHMQPHSLVRNDMSGEKAMRKFIRRMGEFSLNWLDVFNLAVADAYSKKEQVDASTVETYKQLEQELQNALTSFASPESSSKIVPVLNGNELMQTLGIKSGMHMKDMMEFVKELRDENPAITKQEAIEKVKVQFADVINANRVNKTVDPSQPVPSPQPTKTASSDNVEKNNTCPQHLFKQKQMDIQKSIKEGNLYEANSLLKDLKDKYGKDENVMRLIGLSTFNVLVIDQKYRDNDLLQYLFESAKNKFFDYILGAYILGILLLVDTATDSDVIKEVATRTFHLSPGTVKYVLDVLPKDKIYNKEEYDKIVEFIGKSS